jgi:chondroitin 4-sulfotransferase 11
MPEICFVHVPKTGGISLLVDGVTALGGVEVVTQGPNFTTYRATKRPDLLVTHIGHDGRVRNYMTIAQYKQQHAECFAFGFARNPYDRLVSAFHYVSKGGINEADRRDSIEYLASYHGDFRRFVLDALAGPQPPRIFRQIHLRPQVDWLCDETGRVVVDCLGHFESMDLAYAELARKIGVALPAPSHVNKSKHANYETYYDESLRAVVARAYRADFDQLGYQT